jgi:hypothetical protein
MIDLLPVTCKSETWGAPSRGESGCNVEDSVGGETVLGNYLIERMAFDQFHG